MATPLSPTTDDSKLRFKFPLPRRPPIISRVNAFVVHVVAAIVRSRLVDFMFYVCFRFRDAWEIGDWSHLPARAGGAGREDFAPLFLPLLSPVC